MTIAEIHRETARRMKADPVLELTCGGCGSAITYDDLSRYGARCERCFESYCRATKPASRAPAFADAGRRSWAYQLRWREQHGENLSKLQRESWRSCLRAHRLLDAAKAGTSMASTEDITQALRDTGDIPAPGLADYDDSEFA